MLNGSVPALIGLAGVLIGLAVNAAWQSHLERKKTENARKLEQERIDHERRVLRSGLRAELRYLIGSIAEEEAFVRTSGSPVTFVPILNWFSFYAANLGKLGLLSEGEVSAVTRSFYYVRERTIYIVRWGRDYRLDTQSGAASVEFDIVDVTLRKRLLDKLYDIRTDAERSLAVIEKESR